MDESTTAWRESARQRALRIPLDYHRARTGLGTSKVALGACLFALGGAYFAWILCGGRMAQTQLSPGALASAHARWESDCRACHVPLSPVRSDSAASRGAGILFGGAHEGADAKCSACHKTAGPHHANQIAAEVGSCASCHREHQGKQAQLSVMSDQECTRCHDSIAGHRSSTATIPTKDVSSFSLASPDQAQPHPKFRSLEVASDPGSIRFSHRLHMTPGQLYPGQSPPPGKKLVQLQCESCHQDSPAPLGGGAYMQPIKFDQHCRSCHPLQLPGTPTAVPHGLKGPQIEAVVSGLLGGEEERPVTLPQRMVPGKTRLDDAEQTKREPPREMLAASRLQQLRANSCTKCHSWQDDHPTEVVPASIPVVWLKGAKFNHAAHRAAAKCQDCHPQAYEKAPRENGGSLADHQRVMIPDIDNCARCHAPKNDSAGTGGARYDCAECHRYHTNPENPLPPTFAVLQLLEEMNPPPAPIKKAHPFVGTQSCSAAGCHGAIEGTDFTSSFSRFTAADPHTGAFLLLYTPSSLNIYRRLTNQPQAKVEDGAYFQFVKEKCLGCHATPQVDVATASRPENFAGGVNCESCHGEAEKWEFTHFDRTIKAGPRPVDLTDHSVSAATCAQCHIGPQHIAGKSYDVNHDLIAAGHPRLTFEFEAQLANLPAHWSAAKDVKSHFDAWRVGELATATQQDQLYAGRPALEFASHRCFDCHHGLTPNPAAGRVVFPPLAVISKEHREMLAGATPSTKMPASFLLKLLSIVSDDGNKGTAGTRWEEHVHFSLGLSAYVADDRQNDVLAKHAVALNEILANSNSPMPSDTKLKKEPLFAGSLYDSPTGFDPKEKRLKNVLENIRKSLASP